MEKFIIFGKISFTLFFAFIIIFDKKPSILNKFLSTINRTIFISVKIKFSFLRSIHIFSRFDFFEIFKRHLSLI